MKIVAHCLVKNEENFIWFSINSIIDYVDEVLVWDHGSRDSTIQIIKSIKNPKIKFKKVSGKVSELRQEMLNQTEADWIFILDGDEIWYEAGIKDLVEKIKNSKYGVLVSPNYLLVGDMFHYQENVAGRYRILNKIGHYNIRAIRKTLGLHVVGTYPNEAYVNKSGVKVQELPHSSVLFLNDKYLHASFLLRSCKDRKKIKYEIGETFPLDFYYPEVFFKYRPKNIKSPWKIMTLGYKLVANVLTPLKKIRRRLIWPK